MRFSLTAAALIGAVSGLGAFERAAEVIQDQHEARMYNALNELPRSVAAESNKKPGYLNSKSRQFAVDGKHIPEVNFDVGESYAGLLPISTAKDESRKLFFWFFPSEAKEASDEIVIWLNGGPGCSSLSGLLTENGPFLWQSGTKSPVKNPYSWSRLSNVVWVEQPVGTGYSTGKPNITDEKSLGEEFKGFWKNFVNTFELKGRKVYITGESYAGFYVPYIANSFLLANDTDNFNLKGIAINDPVIGNDELQSELVALPFARYWSHLLNIGSSTLQKWQKTADSCGYTKYLDKFLSFPPPKAPFDEPPNDCGIYRQVGRAAGQSNPCFNIYHISEQCPFTYGQLGIINEGDYTPPGAIIYFNRTDVKKAIHAPLNSNWEQCSGPVFPKGDASIGPALDGTLTNVIDKTKNVLIGSGDLDFILISNGTLFALQNTTWGGQNGFQKRPDTPFFVPNDTNTFQGATGGHGNLGIWREERGLTWYTIELSGHELPGYSLTGGFRVLQRLLGRVKDFSSTAPLF